MMLRIKNLSELENIKADKKQTIKLIESSKISNEDLKDYISKQTGDMNIKINDRKTLCRLIERYVRKSE